MTSSSHFHRKLSSGITCKAFSRVSIDASLATIPLDIMIINRLQALPRMHVEYYTILPITCHYCMFLCVKPISRTIHSHVPGPAKGPGVDEIHGTAVSSPVSGVSPGQVVVVTVGAISKSCAVSERNSSGISCTHDREPSKDRGGRDDVYDLFAM